MSPDLSIVIPALNEQDYLPALLADLNAQENVHLEVIIADGGSTDETLARCRSFNPVIVKAPRGRAKQLNAGYRRSTGSNLLFLHADSRITDTRLLHNALSHWQQILVKSDRDAVAGHFPLKFIRTQKGNNLSFRYTEGKTYFNRTNTTNGDQGFLLKRSFFETLGKFDESQPILEDQKLAETIRRRGHWITLPGVLYTSGRRFEMQGYHRLLILMSLLMAFYNTGRVEFFERAGGIYPSHDETGHLLLKPYFLAAIKMFVYDLGWWKSVCAWFSIGRYIRQNSWQMFYFFDVLFRTSEIKPAYPFLKFHDRYFGPLTDNPVCDTINTMISFVWFVGVLGPYFFITDTIRPSGPQTKALAT
ncbi:MAG: TIGR04283 family arsenosugar biosynthesis glycosyltransferase [Desulfosarcina sp.]|jgi:rSAM/selenodomain-associated transferase 2